MIIFGADHAGFELKEYLKTYLYNKGFEIYDAGAFEYDSEDSFANIVPKTIKVLQESKDSKAMPTTTMLLCLTSFSCFFLLEIYAK